MLPTWLLDRASPIAPATAAAGALVYVALVVAGHTAQSLPASAQGDEPPAVAAEGETALPRGRPGLEVIRALPERHLFGTADAKPPRPDAAVIDAAEGGLALSGILHDTEGNSLAIVLSDSGPAQVVAVGDVLASGQRVERIDAGQVLLRSEQGTLASLALPRPKSLGPAPARPIARAVAANPQPVGRSGRLRYSGSTPTR